MKSSSSAIPTSSHGNRRQWLIAALSAAAVGCSRDKSDESSDRAADKASDVPIRLLMFGSPSDGEALTQAWSTVASTPVTVTSVPVERGDLAAISREFMDKVGKTDLILYPLILQGHLATSESIVPESEESFDRYDSELGKTALALRRGACQFGGEFFGISLGSRLPALLSVDETEPLDRWDDYRQWVATLKGKAAEPLAPGWAAESFLQRAASKITQAWLFDRDRVSPRIASDEYVDVLEQLADTAKLYEQPRLTPAEIWARLRRGELRGGIGFETTVELNATSDSDEGELDVSVGDLPSELPTPAVLLNSLSPLVAISSRCRQTNVSKQLLAWMSGGEGSERLSDQISAITTSREPSGENGRPSSYEIWLRSRLNSSRTRTSLQLIDGGEYYAALDECVRRCLDGKATASEALREATERWETITERVGRRRQASVWRSAER